MGTWRNLKLTLGAAAALTAVLAMPATAQEEKEWRHGLSLFGSLKYPAGFKHFDYVNPQAPERRHRTPDRDRHV